MRRDYACIRGHQLWRSPMHREETIFLAAIEKPHSERQTFVEQSCGEDHELRRRVASLIKSHEDGGDFLNVPPVATHDPRLETEGAGARIGRYRLLEQIGEGGFGVVYMAEQEQPVKRRVAFKIIKLGMDTKQVIGRFEAERQALAMMDHPNIAKVLDAGATKTGRPYFVMELVRGVPITEFCDAHDLGTSIRLKLVAEVCHAVQHAHQKGIIHRDIKPTNVLITVRDERPIPKVIDFGIAKATQRRLTEQTVFTEFRQLIGTPAYMSPEQANFVSEDIDTRSDIYSLGVLLYELLTGMTPLDRKQLVQGGYDEIRRRIQVFEPPTPSNRLSSLTDVELANVANHRHCEPAKLRKILRGDLDWIVMKAIEKDRSRRYDTANDLAKDIQRFLDREPVSAIAPSFLYRLRKFVDRNKATVAMASAVVATLLIGIAVSSWQAVRATRQSVRAVAAERDARDAERDAIQQSRRAERGEQLAQRNLYVAEMVIAQREFDELNTARTLELLERQIPRPGQPDFRGLEWRILWNECHGDAFTLSGHTKYLADIAITSDGAWLATASADKTARLWNLASRKEVWSGPGPLGVDFSRNQTFLVTATWWNAILWNITDPNAVSEYRRFKGGCKAVRFSPDGESIVTGALDGRVWQWSVHGDGKVEFSDSDEPDGKAHRSQIESVAFSSDGETLVTASTDFTAKVWNASTRELVATLRGHDAPIQHVAVSPTDSNLIVTASEDGSARVWSRSGAQLRKLPIPASTLVTSADFSSDGRSLAVRQSYSGLRVFDTTTWVETAFHRTPAAGGALTYSADDQYFLVGGSDGVIRGWKNVSIHSKLDHPSPVRSMEFSPNSKYVAVGMADGRVRLWHIASQSEVLTTPATRTQFGGFYFHSVFSRDFVAFSPDSRHIAAIGPKAVVTVWNIETKERRTVGFEDIRGYYSVAFSDDGRYLFLGTASGNDRGVIVCDWQDVETPIVTELPQPGPYGVVSLRRSRDGSMLASGRKGIKLWRTNDLTLIDEIELPERFREKGAFSIAIAQDNSKLAAGSYDVSAHVWDTRTRKVITLPHREAVVHVAFSRDASRLLASDYSGMTMLWDIESQRAIATYKGSVADLSPDGAMLAVGCEGGPFSPMPGAGRVTLHYAPPLAEIDRRIADEKNGN